MARNTELAREAVNRYQGGKMFFYDHITHHKTFTVHNGAVTIVNETINVPHPADELQGTGRSGCASVESMYSWIHTFAEKWELFRVIVIPTYSETIISSPTALIRRCP